MNFKGKLAIVTGGSRDIGKAISVRLAQTGANVVINYLNNEEQANKTLSEISEAGGEAIAVKADVTKQDQVKQLYAEAQKAFGPKVHFLVNNAGGLVERRTLGEMDEAFFNYVMSLNMNSAFLMTQEAVPAMDKGASIINIASLAGRDGGGPGASAYATSKGALMTFTRAMAKELGPQGIRVNSLCPGMISTTFHDIFSKDEVRAKVAGSTPLRREGRAAEVADAVAYLCSEQSSFITGVNLDVNGGLFFS
ncbi:MAG: glucose 1-dehydrogenase [Aquisalinus sp.]|nr:glucose 1-dehydrogenase [Aquisalinus sp.]